jgi:hypothetical protein
MQKSQIILVKNSGVVMPQGHRPGGGETAMSETR